MSVAHLSSAQEGQCGFEAAAIDFSRLRGPYDCVFDVGGNEGAFAMRAILLWRGVEVTSFEPVPDVARRLRRTAAGVPRWRVFPFGLADRTLRRRMFRNEATACSSILPMTPLHREAFPYSSRTEVVEADFHRLDEFASLIHGSALLKIDTQGSEALVLRGGTEVLPRFRAVVVEVSHEKLYDGAPSFEALDEELRRAGLAFAGWVGSLPHPQDGRLLQADGLWVKQGGSVAEAGA